MRKITYFCDRCGKLIEGIIPQIGTRFLDSEGNEEDHEYGAELCRDCFGEIDDMIAYMVKNPSVHFSNGEKIKPKDPKKSNNKSKLDLGKIAALRNAGWTIDKIADEMKVSHQTIRNHMDEAQAFLKNKEALEQMLEKDIQEVES